jgi:hypothetical protein
MWFPLDEPGEGAGRLALWVGRCLAAEEHRDQGRIANSRFGLIA